jgi:DNA-binding MarR family transcriptional regulator
MADAIDVKEIMGCQCLGVRRLARHLTQMYDEILAPTGLTVGQFGLMTRLYGHAQAGQRNLPPRQLAKLQGMDPTTLSRTLGPLRDAGFVADDRDAKDKRRRAVRLTDKGRAKLQQVVPVWRKAHRQVNEALGADLSGQLLRTVQSSIEQLSA